jgi:HlyD family secretion protein
MEQRTSTAQKFGSNRWWIVLLLIAAAVVILAAFISQRRGVVPVRTTHPVRITITSSISTNGKIETLDNFEAHAPAATTVKHVLVHEGDKVKRDQLLLQLEDADARAQAARARAQLRAAEADLQAVQKGGTNEEVLTNQSQLIKARGERDAAQRNLEALKRLQQRGAASGGEVQEAESRLRRAEADLSLLQQKQSGRFSVPEQAKVEAAAAQARAALDAAEELLRNSNIRASRDGTVYSLPVRSGQFVNAGELLVQVADLKSMQVRAFVDEPDVGRLAIGQKVLITWDAVPGRTWEGILTHVPTTVTTRGTRNVGEITCVVDNSERVLLPNVNVSVNIITAQHENALTVPREAVHQEDGRRYVYEVINGELRRTNVQTSVSNLTSIEVTSGLKDDAAIVLAATNSRPLREGQAVKVVQ